VVWLAATELRDALDGPTRSERVRFGERRAVGRTATQPVLFGVLRGLLSPPRPVSAPRQLAKASRHEIVGEAGLEAGRPHGGERRRVSLEG